MTERSEWHSPAATMRTRTSPGPGSARSISRTSSAGVSAYGPGDAGARENGPWILSLVAAASAVEDALDLAEAVGEGVDVVAVE